MESYKLTDLCYYVGVNDRHKSLFENMIPLSNGVSYNSYLINDQKKVLIDTVESPFFEGLLANIHSVIGDAELDYVVVNHVEPDHSSGLLMLKRIYPGMQIVANKKAIEMIKGYYGIEDGYIEVKDGEVLNLGTKNIQFYCTPMVHWPEVMMTYFVEDKILFSADAFGCFGALNGAVIDKDMDLEIYYSEMYRYYANIVGKYGLPVQNALKKLSSLQIDMICSTHGPVWSQCVNHVVEVYDKLSKYEAQEGVVIVYGSMYGHTEQMAEMIARGAATVVKHVKLHDVSRSDSADIITDLFKYKGFVCGSPTYCGELYPGIASLLMKVETRGIKNRIFGCFGSFTWAGATMKPFSAFAEKMKWNISGTVEVKQTMSELQQDELFELGKNIALLTKN